MVNVIYQYWDGDLTTEVETSVKLMKQYAERIGAEHIFEQNPKWQTDLGRYSPHYGSFKPIYAEEFEKYDSVLYLDTDIFPVDNLTDNIFDQFVDTDVDIGICEEWDQPRVRRLHSVGGINHDNDMKWARTVESMFAHSMPRTDDGAPRIYNSGVMVFTKKGRERAREKFYPFKQYVNAIANFGFPSFYTCDQPYIHAMLPRFNWVTMDYKWNSTVHYKPGTRGDNRPVVDLRDGANFVHVQLNGADKYSEDKLWRVTNRPVEEW